MKKKAVRKYHRHHTHQYERPIRWLPIDSRFITPVFKFGRVKGMARLFLEIEITLAIFIVGGTLLAAAIKIFATMTR
jgi:hypothetical protein